MNINLNFIEHAKTLNNMAQNEQLLRKKYYEEYNTNKTQLQKQIIKVDEQNTITLKQIINQIGLPTISKVGKEASFNAWLIVQHSDDIEFQKQYLTMLKQNTTDINIHNIAYLEDRVLIKQNKPQIYGTQFTYNKDTKQKELLPTQDLKNLNNLRKNFKLEPIEDYLK